MTPLQFYKCLADDTRLRSLLLLEAHGELCVCELMAALEESQPKVSRHLAQLRECGLLVGERDGQWVFYRLAPDLPEWCKTVLVDTRTANEDWIRTDSERLNAMGDRPERVARCC
ncbi:metalloregulator ArsR/SmtB family transcription factor [Saccharospirillum salsuginis]|uniref:Transcriptional regulator n=1 Tax=Saccharospirillum salsuginis TaxID=418750 RepID=A0A918KLB3_9GAMM|nr:metalloregulator ArsR/SmtB family transcription factor [Saccharospirillum salsuginis]GGX67688.1 transcriptional regulator [Saccharospirillum salsuginis]